MTRKHFIALAAINKARVEHYSTTEHDRTVLYTLILEQCAAFKAANPLFDQAKFLTASGF